MSITSAGLARAASNQLGPENGDEYSCNTQKDTNAEESGIETRHLGDDAHACYRFTSCQNSFLLPMAPSVSHTCDLLFLPAFPPHLSAAPSPNHFDPHRFRPNCNQMLPSLAPTSLLLLFLRLLLLYSQFFIPVQAARGLLEIVMAPTTEIGFVGGVVGVEHGDEAGTLW